MAEIELSQIKELIRQAIAAKEFSYSPYSHFRVGAALLDRTGRIYTGCNIENAAFSPTNCAERTAFFKAVSEGSRNFSAIAIAGSLEGTPDEDAAYCPPCGVCRQVMAEFCSPEDFLVILARNEDDYRCFRLKDLLPHGFSGEDIGH